MAKAKKLPSGNWNVVVFAGTDEATGKRQYESFTAPTKKEAEYQAAEFALKRKDRKNGNITVKEALGRYVESKKTILSPSTYREYKTSVERDLKDLHNIKLWDLTQELIQKAIDKEAETHSAKTVKNMHGLLSSTLSMFLPDLRLRTSLPKKERQKKYIPTDQDIKTLLEYAEGKPIEIPILLAATGSLRRGEISALTVEDVTDLGVNITKAMVLNDNREWVVKGPKTEAGYRFSPLPPQVVAKVRAGLPCATPDTISHQFIAALKKCGLPHFRFHDLRHYYASVLHALGVPDKYIMLNGGWESDEVLKNVYQHALTDRAEQENAKVVQFFGNLYPGDDAKRNAK